MPTSALLKVLPDESPATTPWTRSTSYASASVSGVPLTPVMTLPITWLTLDVATPSLTEAASLFATGGWFMKISMLAVVDAMPPLP